jgi:DNA-binding response OmpR family regulator
MGNRILIVDDDVDFVDKIREKLELEKYEVIAAFDGEDGLEKAESEYPDLIILDVVLPKMNGYAFIAQVWQKESLRSIPIIIVTAYEALIKFVEIEGVKDHLIKPFPIKELLFRIRKYIGEVKAKKILLIDNDEEHIRTLEPKLRAFRYAVVIAMTGKEGLEKSKKERPDLIVMNALITEMDGYEFLKAIKRDPEIARIPIVTLSPRGMMDLFVTLGAEETFALPFDGLELAGRINFLLKNKAVVYCTDEFTLDRIVNPLKDRDFDVHTVADEESLLKSIGEIRYKVIVLYLPVIKSEPEDLIKKIRDSRGKDSIIIVFSNAKVKGTEKDNIAVIREIKRRWLKANADAFFDLRIADNDFPVLLDSSIGTDVDMGAKFY